MVLDIKYFIICLAISSFLLIPIANVRANSSTHYYAGYYYYGYTGSGLRGVSADIFTEWLEMPINSWAVEWIAVVLDYSPAYWIQTGYYQSYTWIIFPVVYWKFFLEVMDENGHELDKFGSPGVGYTYTYTIRYQYDPNSGSYRYRYIIAYGSTELYDDWVSAVSQIPVDLQAFVETPTTQINIGGSHFKKMLKWGTRWWFDFSYWDRHWPNTDPPYYLDEISHYEFYAYGGSL